ncbi:MAG: hypothetical protein KKF33_19990, partial [Alphaproteobacteria bacterium]|nr:hypothetical protein [Alphaproteobacteria bacterium]
NTLAAVDYAVAIPMLTTQLRLFVLWPPTVMSVYGDTHDREREAEIRWKATDYLFGRQEYLAEFREALGENVDNVIVSKRLAAKTDVIGLELRSLGFRVVADSQRYTAYVRGDTDQL